MIAIIDYGMGNVASVKKALQFINAESIITSDHNIIKACEFIVLPGVGSFGQGMQNLEDRGLTDLLTDEVINKKKKFLGICLGMQLVMENGTEPHDCKGLGWVKGNVIKFELQGLRVPHMGWNNIEVVNDTHYKNIKDHDFYFIHSYHVVPDDKSVIAATVDYGFKVTASIQKDNIFATQFHPEKSQLAGIEVLNSFFGSYA